MPGYPGIAVTGPIFAGNYRLRDTVKPQPSSRPMPRPAITAADILEKRRRKDGGADLLVQVTLRNGVVHWLAVRQADAMLTATRTVEGHGRHLVTVPARRTLKAGLAQGQRMKPSKS
jgi:hypothetical protein